MNSVAFRGPLLAAMVAAAGACGGCSIAVPVTATDRAASAALWGANADDVTGSISKKAPRGLSRALDAEDMRRATAAMNTALDPQGNGGAVKWDNPHSGAKGSFTPLGNAYPNDGRICRAFRADIATPGQREELQGAACREKSAEWTLTEVRGAAKS